MLSCHNFARNITKWKICKNCEKKEIQNEIYIIFSCNRNGNIRRIAFNDTNEVESIKLQVENKIEKLKLFLAEGSLKALNIFGQFLMRTFGSR